MAYEAISGTCVVCGLHCVEWKAQVEFTSIKGWLTKSLTKNYLHWRYPVQSTSWNRLYTFPALTSHLFRRKQVSSSRSCWKTRAHEHQWARSIYQRNAADLRGRRRCSKGICSKGILETYEKRSGDARNLRRVNPVPQRPPTFQASQQITWIKVYIFSIQYRTFMTENSALCPISILQ